MDESERSRHLDLVYTGVVGMFVAVSWSYIVVEALDPDQKCPGISRCWRLVGSLGATVVVFAFLLPYVSLKARRSSSLEEPLLTTSFRSQFHLRLMCLIADSTGTVWSVSTSSFLYYLLEQIGEGMVNPPNGGQSDRSEADFAPPILLLLVAVCVVSALVLLWAATAAASRIPDESRPYWKEVWGILARSTFYPSAYVSSVALGLLFFLPYELGKTGNAATVSMAAVRAATYWFLGRWISRVLPKLPEDANERIREASESARRSFEIWASTSAGVLACIGINDAVVALVEDALDISVWAQIAVFFFVWVPLLLAFALARSRSRTSNRDAETKEGCCVAFQLYHPNDRAFVDTAELWLVSFAFWSPYKLLIFQLWDLVNFTNNASNALFFVVAAARLLTMLLFASCLTVLFACAAAGAVVAAQTLKSSLSTHSAD